MEVTTNYNIGSYYKNYTSRPSCVATAAGFYQWLVHLEIRGLFAGVLLVTFGGLTVSGAGHAATAPRFQHAAQPCNECHTGQRYDALFQQGECETCHDQHIRAEAVQAANNTPVRRGMKTGLQTGLPPGMSVPMYYDKTRIGAKPNKMVVIPGGEFIRGTNERFPDEGPQYVASVGAFQIDVYEVTNLQYKQFMDATQHKSPKHFENRTYPPGKADHPVVYVSWYDAKEYCAWAGKRLPTDIEWEKAARGTDGRTYAWGNDFSVEMANTPQRWGSMEQPGDTTPVGAFPQGKSIYGLYDVSGNVWEWTSSWYKAYPGNKRKVENYGEIYKTLKGGSWWDCSFYKCGISAPLYNRSFFYRKTKNKSFGFRCAKDIE